MGGDEDRTEGGRCDRYEVIGMVLAPYGWGVYVNEAYDILRRLLALNLNQTTISA